MNQKIKLTEAQMEKKKFILKCIAKEMRTLEAALCLNLTQRAVQQNIERYKKLGDSAFIHGNKGKKRVNIFYENLKEEVIAIFQNTLVDGVNPFEKISYAYFTEILNEEYKLKIKVSTTWVKNILKSVGYESPRRHNCKRTETHFFRPSKEHLGELVQADGSSYDWFGDGHQYCIQGFVDDAEGIPLGLYMTKHECLLGYMESFRYMAWKHGLPMQLYPDKASVFFVNNNKDKTEKHLTQFGRMMEKLGVDMFPAHSPQAKGRIERFWQTLQGRLPIQFKLHGIKTIEEANRFLQEVYIPKYIKRFARKAKSEESFFIKVDFKELNEILKATFTGKTDRGGVFSLMGYKFFTPDLPNQKINIHLNEKDGLWITSEKSSRRYEVQLVETDTTGSMPEVMQLLIEQVFLKNAKPRFREVYMDIDYEKLSNFKKEKNKIA